MRGFGSTRGALAALAFACAASVWLHLTGERAISGSSAVLGSPAYDMQSVVAPAASGPLLTALTYILTATPLGPPIRRFLLNDNKVEILRELAAQSNNTPPLYYPMRRVDAAVHEAHAAAASSPDGSLSVALRDGFAPPSTAGDVAAAVPRPRQSSTAAASVYITSEDLHAATPNPDPSPNPNPNPNPNQDPNPNPNPNPSRHLMARRRLGDSLEHLRVPLARLGQPRGRHQPSGGELGGRLVVHHLAQRARDPG